jgi:hypothetical protein
VVEYPPNKCKALSSTPSTAKKNLNVDSSYIDTLNIDSYNLKMKVEKMSVLDK